VIWDYFKQRLFPHRQLLLSALSEASSGSRSSNTDTSSECEQAQSALLQTEMNILTGTPLASVLLPHMTVAVMLMKADKKI
jgi:hypothetical protein